MTSNFPQLVKVFSPPGSSRRPRCNASGGRQQPPAEKAPAKRGHMPDQLRGLGKYTILPVPLEAKKQFEEKMRRHEGVRRLFVSCARCLSGYGHSEEFPKCSNCCVHETTITGYMRQSNGICKAQMACLRCGRRRDLRRGETGEIYDLCLKDNTTREPCERCGSSVGVEIQHWAPQAIFADADQWPKAWLCRDCHNLWHSAMRSARGVSLPEGDRVRVEGLNPHLATIAWGRR